MFRRFFYGFIGFFFMVALLSFTPLVKDSSIHTPDYYDVNVTHLFKEGNYSGGFKLLEEGLRVYPTHTQLNELMGNYYYRKKEFDNARYYLYRAVRADNSNVQAKQLLVNVEEETQNYSSAICYINELLEVNPYWKGLWIKKMNIFRKQGNDIEADRLLHRLVEIYPEDISLRRRLRGRMEENLMKYRVQGDKMASIRALREMVNEDPNNMENYLVLSNLLLQNGQRDEALAVVSQGLGVQPNNAVLAEKRVGILAEQHRYSEAIDYIKQFQRIGTSPSLAKILVYLEEESARNAVSNDPYVMYGRMYERNKSREALDFLLNTSVSRGYTSDALFYLSEARKSQGDTPNLLYKEYELYKQMGNHRKAIPLLEKVIEKQPGNSDAINELCTYRIAEAIDMMVTMDYTGSIEKLDYVIQNSTDDETVKSALNKKYTCYFETKRYAAANVLLDSIRSKYPQTPNYIARKTQILTSQDRADEALALLDRILNDSIEPSERAFYLSDYEEVALPYIKSLLQKGATHKAMNATETLLRHYPSSYQGLNYALTCTSLLKRHEEHDLYAKMASNYFPDDARFGIKSVGLLTRQHRYEEALEQLRPWFEHYPNDSTLIGAFSENSELRALQLLREDKPDSALTVLDSALIHDETNISLLYTKGLAYEDLHQFDSAYHYLGYYRPSLMEFEGHKLRLEKLAARSAKNTISLEYLQARFGEQDVLTSVVTASYSHTEDKNTYTATVNYAGRDGLVKGQSSESYVSGGMGLQAIGEWTHEFNPKWTGTVSLGGANKYFPAFIANFKLERNLRKEWSVEGHLGFRVVEKNKRLYVWDDPVKSEWNFSRWDISHTSLLTLGGGVTKTTDQFIFNGKADILLYGKSLCFTTSFSAKYFPMESRLFSVSSMAGIGNAPQDMIIDSALPGAYKHINTNLALGGNYLLSRNLTLGVGGSWLTFPTMINHRIGTKDNPMDILTSKYKNLFTVNASLLLKF